MCGRYTLRTPLSVLAKQFHAELLPDIEWEPRYNIPPTTAVPAVRLNEQKHRELVRLKWGLIPSWSKDAKIAYSTINARSDTVATKIMDILDGTSNTLLMVEVKNSGIKWTEPRDLDLSSLTTLPQGNHPGGNLVLFFRTARCGSSPIRPRPPRFALPPRRTAGNG